MKRALLAALALACGPAPEPTGSASAPILGGALDAADTSVVALLIFSANGPQDDSECSGTVVSPHVILTAAHCLSPEVAGPIDHVTIFLGTDSDDPVQLADPTLNVAVAETHYDSDFSAGGTTHDIGAVVAASDLALAPIPLRRDSLGDGDLGAAVHVVGYGESTGADLTSSGQRRSMDAKIFSVDDSHLGLDDVICFGDSGGPTFLTKDGVVQIAGIHSFGPPDNCVGIGEDTRVDRYTSFVDSIVSSADPGFPTGGGCSTSGARPDATLGLALVALALRRRTKNGL